MGIAESIDLTSQQYKTIKTLISHHLPNTTVWAYGSRVRWTSRPQSDLDLAAFSSKKQTLQIVSLREAFEESDLPFRVDLLVWDEIPEKFHENIKAERVVVQEAKVKTVPVGWDIIPAYKYCESVRDGTHDSPKKVKKGKFLITSRHIKGYSLDFDNAYYISNEDFEQIAKRSEVDQWDILFGMIGTIGDIYIERDEKVNYAIKNVGLFKNTGDKQKSYWLNYYLKSPFAKEYIHSVRTGTTQEYVTLGSLRNFPIMVPPNNDRDKIVSILKSLDDKIELNQKMNQTLEEMAQAIFKEWFVDFRFPGHEKVKFIDGLPEGWKPVTIDDVSDIVAMGPFGSNIKVSTFVKEGVPVISGKHLKGTMLEDLDFNFITERHAQKLNKSIVFRGDVVFTHAGSVGQVSYIPKTSKYEKYVLSQRQFYMRPDLGKVSPFFIIRYFKSRIGQHELLANVSQVGVPSISRPVTNLRKIEIVLPPKHLLDKFDSVIQNVYDKYELNVKNTENLSCLRDCLLPKLLNGEIDISKMQAEEPKV